MYPQKEHLLRKRKVNQYLKGSFILERKRRRFLPVATAATKNKEKIAFALT